MSTFLTPGIQKCENLTFSHFWIPHRTRSDEPRPALARARRGFGILKLLGFWKLQNLHASRGKAGRKELKTPRNSDRDGGRSPPQDDVYQQKNHISWTRGFRWGVTRRVADICRLFLGQGVTSDFRKFPQARSAVGVRRKKRIFLRRRRNDFRRRSVNHFVCDERRFSSSDVPPGATKWRDPEMWKMSDFHIFGFLGSKK